MGSDFEFLVIAWLLAFLTLKSDFFMSVRR